VIALQDETPDGSRLAHLAFKAAHHSGDIDPYVSIYRAFPRLLEAPAGDTSVRRALNRILENARDDEIARRLGFHHRPTSRTRLGTLTTREREVLDLMSQGLTNRQIASILFIEESTAKVHVRHIFEKIGAKTRVEAVRKAAASEREL
jgi:DNA-binding CsgD family transcriptional regulator